MQGANQYAWMFKTGQYDRFYITSGSHARGSTFHIQILPEGIRAIPNGPSPNNLCVNENAVEVYGIIGGHPGWTESYGWLHQGKWQNDFEKLVKEKLAWLHLQEAESARRLALIKEEELSRQKQLLDNYR